MPWHKADNIAFYYKPPIDHWILLLKFHHQLQYGHLLGQLFSQKLKKREELPNLIVPVPLHIKRLCRRGFNQAIEIAKPISRQLKIPLDRKSLKRIQHTKPQSQLTETERTNNLSKAFCCTRIPKENSIAVFDDVITTGSTIDSAYNTLKKAGISHIEKWCCAKT